MRPDRSDLKILIFVTCENATFKHRYSISIKQWLSKASETFDKKPVLKFTEVNIITSGIPKLDEIKNYDGIVISGSFSRTRDNTPWMQQLCHTIRLCYVNQIPIFGICFGFQILSKAFGSSCKPSPHGFNFGVLLYNLSDKASPFFRPYIEDFYSGDKALGLFNTDSDHYSSNVNNHISNNTGNSVLREDNLSNNHRISVDNEHYDNETEVDDRPNHVVKKSMDSMIGAFSHNDVVTSSPNIENIDFGGISDTDRSELYKGLYDLVPITISSHEKVPFVGLLIGNKSKTFMVAVQLHPEFDTVSGKEFWKEILSLKVSQGVITNEQSYDNLRALKYSNSGYVYGKMALSLFMNGYLLPKY